MRTCAGALLCVFAFLSCTNTTENVVGSTSDTTIPSMSITVSSLYLGSNTLVAEGMVKNDGTASTTVPWYVEAQFYTDSIYTIRLGGNYTQISAPLASGQQTFWKISYASSNVNVLQFPDFRVGDLRAIYKN
jgi:hypothetical protein